MTLADVQRMPFNEAMQLDRRVERAYAAFIAALPTAWIYDKVTNCVGFVMPWEQLNGLERDAWRAAVATLEDA